MQRSFDMHVYIYVCIYTYIHIYIYIYTYETRGFCVCEGTCAAVLRTWQKSFLWNVLSHFAACFVTFLAEVSCSCLGICPLTTCFGKPAFCEVRVWNGLQAQQQFLLQGALFRMHCIQIALRVTSHRLFACCYKLLELSW